MPNANKSLVALVVDRSGSMEPLTNDTIGSINKFIEDQKAVPGECDFTLWQFSTGEMEPTYVATPLSQVQPLTKKTYRTGGGTALLDAMGKCIDVTGIRLDQQAEADKPANVIFVVLTDGEENSSVEYAASQVAAKVKHQSEKYGWKFIFMGANMDAIAAGGSVGVAAAASMNYVASPQGLRKAYSVASASVTRGRTGGSVDITDDERK